MKKNIIIKCYKKDDFRSWIIKGVDNGLNESIISRNRAIAQMNNPDAELDDILLTIAKVDGVTVGYKGVVPEKLYYESESVKIGWGSTFFVIIDFRGQGIARDLLEPFLNYYSHGLGSIHSSENVLKLHKKLSWNISFIKKTTFVFRLYKPKNYSTNIIFKRAIGIFRPGLNYLIGLFHSLWLKKSYKKKYELEYTSIISNQLYQFIKDNAGKDLFIKSQEKLNWILKYKWASIAPCLGRTDQDYYFKNYVTDFFQGAVVVKKRGNIIGFYILRRESGHLTVPFLYSDNNNNKYVFRSILEHIIELKAVSFSTFNEGLINFINNSQLNYFFKQRKKISYSHTNQKYFEKGIFNIQDGDGDLFF